MFLYQMNKGSNIVLSLFFLLPLVAALILPALIGPLVCTKNNQVRSDLGSLEHVFYTYYSRFQYLPEGSPGFDMLVTEGLLPKVPFDPWIQPYRYTLIDKTHFQICSLGENKIDDHGFGDDLCETGDVENKLRFFNDKKSVNPL